MSYQRIFLALIGIVALLFGTLGITVISAQDVEMPAIISAVKWHPHGEGLLVTGRASPGVFGMWLFDTDMRLVRMFPNENRVSADWSPDGTRLSMGRNILDVQTLEVLLTLDAKSGIGGWSPDGSQVLAWVDENHLGLFDSRTGEVIRTVAVGEMIPEAVSWSPNGEYFVLFQPVGTTNIISAEDGRQIATVPIEYPVGLRWSPDSRYLAAAFTTRVEPGTPNTLSDAASPTVASVVVWEALTGSIVQTFSGLPALPLMLRWHPQRPELAGGAGQGLLFVWNIETGEQENIFRTISALTSLDYSPFGGRLVVGSRTPDQVVFDGRSYPMAGQVGWSRDVVTETLQMIIPDPSVELLESVETVCVPESQAEALPNVDATTQDLTAYVEAVRQNSRIPPGCQAELLAVAEAIQSR